MLCKNQKEEKKILNSICEVSIDGKMALVSLYDDLPHFEYDLTIDNLKNSVTKLKKIIQELKQHIKNLENESTHLQTINNVLSKNITSLYKTAALEIQRKDKIIDDLRKSQVVPLPSTSEMYSSSNNFQIEKTEVNKLSESGNNTEKIQNTIEKSKVLNPTNNDNITTLVIKPDRDIPQTIYSKRMCQKLAQQNYTIESIKQMSPQIENSSTADKIIQDTNEDLNNDEDKLKEMSTSLIHNESKDIINSTLVICESDVTPSDCELDTTPVIQCDNQEKNKENVSIDSCFSKLKQPTKLKKKLIMTPATIGVQNTRSKTLKCAKKTNQIKSLASITESEITSSPKKPVEKSLNKDTRSTCIKNNFPEYDPKIEDKPLTIDVLHNKQLLASEKNNQIQSLNIEDEQFPIRRKKKVIEKDSNILALMNIEKLSQITVTCMSSSVDNEFNKSMENVKCLSMNNDREALSPSQQKNLSKCNLDILECANSMTESKHLNNSCKSSFKKTSIETSPTNKSVLSSINNEAKQVPITRKMNAIKKDNNTLKKSKKVTQESCIKDHKNKYDSNMDDKQLSTDTLHNQKLSTYDNKKPISSINIEVEQVPVIRKTKVLENNHNNLNRFKKVTRVSCIKDNKNKNGSNTNDEQLSTDTLHNQKLSTYDNKKQISSINIEVEQVPVIRKTKVLENNHNTLNRFKKVTQVSCIKDNKNEDGSKTDDKQLSTDILCNQKLSTPEKINQNKVSSINIEVEQVPIIRKTKVLENNHNTLNRFKKVTQVSCIKDNKNEDGSKTDDKQLSTDILCNQKLSTPEKINQNKVSSINIEVEQVPIIRKTKVLENNHNTLNRFKKVIQVSCIKDNKNEDGSKTDDKQLSTDILCNQKLSTPEKINQNKISSINIEVEQFPIRRRKTVVEKDNKSIDLSNVRKRSCVTYMSSSINNKFNKSTENVDREPFQQKNNQSNCNFDTLTSANSITESKHLINSFKSSSENISIDTSPTNKPVIPSINIEVEQGFIFKQSNARKVIMRLTSDDKQETKKGRHVQLITIKDHYSKPVPIFNGAKKTDIDVSTKSIVTEKVVESSSHFYVPQVKRRRTMNFGSADS